MEIAADSLVGKKGCLVLRDDLARATQGIATTRLPLTPDLATQSSAARMRAERHHGVQLSRPWNGVTEFLVYS